MSTGPPPRARCPLDAELGTLLARCERLNAATDGAFDITATPLSRCWGLLQREGNVPSPDAIAEARARIGHHLVEIRVEVEGRAGEHGGCVRFARAASS